MNSITRVSRVLALVLVAFSTTACATRYQELLEQRDATIDDLEGQLAQCRAENEQLRRRPVSTSRPPAEPVSDDLDDIRNSVSSQVGVSRTDSGLLSLEIKDEVTFDQGSIQLKAGAASVLRSVSDLLKSRYAGSRIYIRGHTDSVPITNPASRFRSNVHLSVERADAVREWLIKSGGVPERQFAIVGYGPFKPKDRGTSAAADAANRRVEIVIGEAL